MPAPVALFPTVDCLNIRTYIGIYYTYSLSNVAITFNLTINRFRPLQHYTRNIYDMNPKI